MRKIDIALVGIGGYGATYLKAIFEENLLEKINIAGIIDPFAQNSEYLTQLKELNVNIYDTLEEFYAEKSAELVVISTPIHLHKNQCITAMKNNSNVLCEKPITPLLEDANELIEVAKKYGKKLYVGFQMCFCDAITDLKKDLLEGVYGEIKSLKTLVLWPRDLAYYSRGIGWAGKIKDSAGNIIMDSVVTNATAHYLQNLLFLSGDKLEESAELIIDNAVCKKANKIETFDTCIIDGHLQNSAKIKYIASHAVDGATNPVFEIVTQKAVIKFDNDGESNITAQIDGKTVKSYGDPLSEASIRQKLIKVINFTADPTGQEPICTVETCLPFIKATNYLFENISFDEFNRDAVIFDEQKSMYYVKGLKEELENEYTNA